MSNGFGFGPPQTPGFGPPAPAPQGAPAAFGGPQMPHGPGAFRAPLDASQALAGFEGDQIETRFPFLPVGCAVKFDVTEVYSKATMYSPYEIYIEGVVSQVANPGGGQEPAPGVWPENANRAPVVIGQTYTIRIAGFGGFGDKYARAELGQCVCAIFEKQGVRKDWGKELIDAATPNGVQAVSAAKAEIAQRWINLFNGFAPAFKSGVASNAIGGSMLVNTSVTQSKVNRQTGQPTKPKLKCAFYGLSTVGL